MGWWNQSAAGESLMPEETGLVWGDPVADILDYAIDEIDAEFERLWGRRASREELVAGMLFSITPDDDRPAPGSTPARRAPGMLNVGPEGGEGDVAGD